MQEVTLRTNDGGSKKLSSEDLQQLADGLRGKLISPESPEYDEARKIWNAMIDRRPGLILRAAGTADVLSAIRFAGKHRLLTAIRGGGHNIAGKALCDGGLLLDLSAMRSVHVDPAHRTARVEPGATLGDLDHEAQAFGLATPVGVNSTTGVAGLTLGGGFGWLSRKLGMTIDHLISAEVVTADGKLLEANERENSDLFWALRGGGGNFGVVTSFLFRLHPVGPTVHAGLFVHTLDKAPGLLRAYRDLTAKASDDFTVWFVMRKAPPLPFLPPEVHGQDILAFALCHLGEAAAAEADIAKVRALGKGVGEHVGPMPFQAWQKAFDPLLTPGARNYWKSHNFDQLDDKLLDILVAQTARLPSPQCEIFMAQLGGAISRVADDATAYPHRSAAYTMNVHTRWDSPQEDKACVAWARDLFDKATPFANGGVYVNFVPEDEDRVAAAYGGNFERLRAVKQKYDPTNFFRLNQNISAAAA